MIKSETLRKQNNFFVIHFRITITFYSSHALLRLFPSYNQDIPACEIFARLRFQSHCPASDHPARKCDAKTLLPRNKKSHGGQRPIS